MKKLTVEKENQTKLKSNTQFPHKSISTQMKSLSTKPHKEQSIEP
jgi:hypothetical protein